MRISLITYNVFAQQCYFIMLRNMVLYYRKTQHMPIIMMDGQYSFVCC